MMPSQGLLLVDDDLVLGEFIVEALRRNRHDVTWFVRARFDGDKLVLMDIDGKESAVDPSKFDLALIDWRLKGSPINGPEVTSYLVACGLPVVGVSGLPSFNEEMIKAGARGGIAKDVLLTRSIRGDLDITDGFAGETKYSRS